jgi:hypothetical protein
MKTMKKSIFLTAVAIFCSAAIMAQTTGTVQTKRQIRNQTRTEVQNQTQTQTQVQTEVQTQTQTRQQERIHQTDASAQGQNVSTTAQGTESGRGKGEIVSQQARTRGEGQRARTKTGARNQSAGQNAGARGSSVQRNNMRMTGGSGAGRK